MTDFYIDPVSGNDLNDGSTWVLAWKTITAGATAARIAPGDKIKVAKSSNPTSVGSATWNNLSKTVTLATALTANVDLCDGAVSAASPGTQIFRGCTFGETTKVAGQVAWLNGRVCLNAHDGSTDNNYVYTDGGIIKSQSLVRHTASGIAWQLSPTSANRSAYYPLFMSLAKIAVAADSQVTVSCWFRRSSTGITGKLVCRGGQIAGVSADVSASMTEAADIWEQLSINFTPTAAGVVEIEVEAFGGTAYSVFVDDALVAAIAT